MSRTIGVFFFAMALYELYPSVLRFVDPLLTFMLSLVAMGQGLKQDFMSPRVLSLGLFVTSHSSETIK